MYDDKSAMPKKVAKLDGTVLYSSTDYSNHSIAKQ